MMSEILKSSTAATDGTTSMMLWPTLTLGWRCNVVKLTPLSTTPGSAVERDGRASVERLCWRRNDQSINQHDSAWDLRCQVPTVGSEVSMRVGSVSSQRATLCVGYRIQRQWLNLRPMEGHFTIHQAAISLDSNFTLVFSTDYDLKLLIVVGKNPVS